MFRSSATSNGSVVRFPDSLRLFIFVECLLFCLIKYLSPYKMIVYRKIFCLNSNSGWLFYFRLYKVAVFLIPGPSFAALILCGSSCNSKETGLF